MKLSTKFDINQKIYIKNLKIFGRILSIFIDNAKQITYNTRYFDSLSHKDVYFMEDELSDKEEDKKVGF